MNKKNKLVASLMATCRSFNRKDFSVFCTYSGHVDAIHIHLNAGGWQGIGETNHTEIKTVYLDNADYYKDISSAKRDLEKYYNMHRRGEKVPEVSNLDLMDF